MDINLLIQIACYIIFATILFNLIKNIFKLNLLSAIILSISVSFLMTTLAFKGTFTDWLAKYMWAIIVLAAFVTMVYVTTLIGCKMPNPKADTNLKEKENE